MDARSFDIDQILSDSWDRKLAQDLVAASACRRRSTPSAFRQAMPAYDDVIAERKPSDDD
ncbi:hypothetical protein ASG57_34415 [Bradyrhizobium sp. Leaf396]|nr:hypothetical protein ASG57_34415 [Bradyrhizobium sp. Leaf396]